MEWETLHIVVTAGFVLAIVFGAIANRTNFCTMGAISDWVNMGSKGRLGAWVLAMGVAVAGTQILELSGKIPLEESIYRTPTFGLLGYILGGLLFGVGMTLSGGCGQRTLVRLGSGNLKALVVFLVLAITAYMTLRGLFGQFRLDHIDSRAIDLTNQGIEDQGLSNLFANWFGWELSSGLRWGVAALISAVLILIALSFKALRQSGENLFAGISIGLIIAGGWAITGILGLDDFDPMPLESMSFVAPSGNSLTYLMTYTGATINFGIAIVFGVIVGSFLYSVLSRSFRIETFTDKQDMINHLLGGLLMGFGGVLSLGCTVGQGVTGVSTLALGSFVAVGSIMIGSAVTLRYQYLRMDDFGVIKALFVGIADIILPWRKLA
ncbi:MAG: YeeE/YedE family protein [Gammaproteobacteria bacterium]|nr:YeeE/YedE family protein [Gammaproteobacteria bacterium]